MVRVRRGATGGKEARGLKAEAETYARRLRWQQQQSTPRRLHAGYRVEPLTSSHIAPVVRVHSEAFPVSLLSAVGPGFLAEILDSYVSLPGGCGYVCRHGEEVVGFVVGTEDSRRHRRLLLHWHWKPILLRMLHGLVLSPRHAGPLARYLRPYLSLPRPWDRNHPEPEGGDAVPPASLVLLGVIPMHRRRGMAARLTRAFLAEMAERGVGAVKLAVAADNEAALAFYISRGWRPAGRYAGPGGRAVYRLIYRLA